MVNDNPELKAKLEKLQKKSKSKKVTDEKNAKSEGRLKVDKFDPERMEINIGNVQTKVDKESVHQLLGIPNGREELTSLTYKKKLEGNVMSWRNLCKEKHVAPPDIVKRISQSSDDDSILFKLDFLLLYVDRVNCPSENIERKMRPIQFWTMNALRSREECEINNGGFGLGEVQELYVDLKGDESDMDEKCNEKEPNMENVSDDFFQPDNLTDIERMIMFFIIFRKQRGKRICGSVYKEIIDVEKDVADTEKIEADTEKDVAVDTKKDVAGDIEKDVEKDKEKERIDPEEKENETTNIEVKVKEIIDTEKKENEIIDPTLPNFSFKLSQSTQESEKESKVDEPTEKTKELLKDGKKKASTPENKYVRKNEKRLKTVTEPLRSPYM
ncbi:hypothetical protein L1987_74645 [Smallanthus sonchifolius]|uniref:Uncharacterized protein n=1 Tax=Smallanthus sonchifolius TaxID=185202 RepID=A0ACB9A7N4_9ASTR|nr:hypothetical protein L1987_74645 [Smallanthus sonchifolius]